MRTNPRFTMSSRTPSLRRLRTAFSSHPVTEDAHGIPSASSANSSESSSTLSPLTRSSRSSSPSSSFSASSAASIKTLLFLRRKPSVIDIEMEEERKCFAYELNLLEPRPRVVGGACGGIFEVLDGRA